MNKTRFLGFAVVGLALLNLGMVGYFFWGNPPLHPNQEGPKKIIIERLHFDAEQVVAYEKLVEKHRSEIKAKGEEISAIKTALYSLLQNDDLSKKDSLISAIGQVQQRIEMIHFQHFSDIKSLCKKEQIKDFNALTSDLAIYFSPNPNKPKRN